MTATESMERLFKSFGNVVEESKFTQGIRAFHSFLVGLDSKLESYQQRAGQRKKYWIELMMKIPLFFFMHQLLLLSPTSDYRLIELVLFVFRYIGKNFVLSLNSHIHVYKNYL